MFYLGTVLLMFGLVQFGDVAEQFADYMLYPYYNSFALTNFWTGLILTALGLICIVKRWGKPHRHTLAGRIYAIILLIFAFGSLLGSISINEYTMLNLFSRIVNTLSFLIPGVLAYIYNRKIEVQPVESVDVSIEPAEPEIYQFGSDIDRLNYKLKQVSDTDYAQTHPEFKKKLNHSIAILDQMQRDDYEVDHVFLEQIAELSDFYLNIEDNEIKTNQSRATLQTIAETFDTIDEALENIYDKNFVLQALDIEGDIAAMKAKLNMSGSLDSPFEKFKNQQINETSLDD